MYLLDVFHTYLYARAYAQYGTDEAQYSMVTRSFSDKEIRST